MEMSDFVQLLGKRKKLIVASAFLFLALAAVWVLSQPLMYGSEARMLVVQNPANGAPLDPYVIAKANEYLGGVLAEVAGSEAFYSEVRAADFNFDKDYFSGDTAAQLALWHKTAEVRAAGNTGILRIKTFHPDKYQAGEIAQAIIYTFKEKHALYDSAGDKVSLKSIDEPLVSRYPIRPNLPLTFGLAVLCGLGFGLSYIYLFSYPIEKYLPGRERVRAAVDKTSDAPAVAKAQPAPMVNLPPQQPPPPQVILQSPNVYIQPTATVTADQGPADSVGRGDMKNVLGGAQSY